MLGLPKLKVKCKYTEQDVHDERTIELEQAKDFYYGSIAGHPLVVLEGQPVYSYEELVQLCAQDKYKDREFLKVELREIALGGG